MCTGIGDALAVCIDVVVSVSLKFVALGDDVRVDARVDLSGVGPKMLFQMSSLLLEFCTFSLGVDVADEFVCPNCLTTLTHSRFLSSRGIRINVETVEWEISVVLKTVSTQE